MTEKRRCTYTNGPCTTVLVEYEEGGVTIQQWQEIGGQSQVVALLSSEWENMCSKHAAETQPSHPVEDTNTLIQLTATITALRDEIMRLHNWKAEALVVLAEWDACYDILAGAGHDAHLGASKARHVADYLRSSLRVISERSEATIVLAPGAPSGDVGNFGHEQVLVRVQERSAQVDAGIADVIRDLWTHGIDTDYSCQGGVTDAGTVHRPYLHGPGKLDVFLFAEILSYHELSILHLDTAWRFGGWRAVLVPLTT